MSQKQRQSIDNRIALTLDDGNSDTLLLKQPIPQNKLQSRQLQKAQHQFWIEKAHMGSPDTLHCWCGASLVIDYAKEGMSLMHSMDAMADEVQSFGRNHQACEPFSNGMQEERDIGGIDA